MEATLTIIDVPFIRGVKTTIDQVTHHTSQRVDPGYWRNVLQERYWAQLESAVFANTRVRDKSIRGEPLEALMEGK